MILVVKLKLEYFQFKIPLGKSICGNVRIPKFGILLPRP